MNEELEEKKQSLKEKLETELYVERYDTFKESVYLINEALKSFGINYQYTYDKFCEDFTSECMEFMDKNPKVDMTDSRQMMIYTLPIIMGIISKTKNKHGYLNEESPEENL